MKNSVGVNNAMAQAFANFVDGGAGPGKIRLYTSPQPGVGGAAITTQTLLAEHVMTDPCAPAPAASVLTFSAIGNDISADASGIIAWVRMLDSNNNHIADLTAGLTGSGAEITFNTNEALAGGIVQITSLTLTWPT